MEGSIDKKTENATELLKTIANPIRLKIILLLNGQGDLSVSTLQHQLNIEQSLLSHHLNKMKDRGVLVSKRYGQSVHYSLSDSIFAEVVKLLYDRQ